MYFNYKHYPFRRPSEFDHGVRQRHPVAIVGAGPVGLSVALDLARYSVPAVVIEARDTLSQGSRACCISRRSLEIWDRMGIGPAMLAKGLPWTGGRSFYRNQEVFQLHMPHDDLQKHPPMINLQQCYAEQFLVDEIAGSELVDLRWQSTVTSVDARDDAVVLTIETPEGAYRLAADWVVACDGARSTMRQVLGLKFEGTSYEGRYLIADIQLDTDHPTERRVWFDPPSNPGSTVIMHRQPDNIWRVDYQLRALDDPEEELKPERIIPRIRSHLEMIGERGDWRLEWASLYKAHCLTLERYRHGRVLFAGDAAHLVPIFGVRGLNSGIDDANNLAWKLAFVIRGSAPAELLDTYSDERVAAARENMRQASKSTGFMTPPSRGYRLMREAVLSLAISNSWVRCLIDPRQTTAIAFPDSRLNAFPEHSAEFTCGPRPGETLPNFPVALQTGNARRRAHLSDALGCRFTGLYFTDSGVLPEGLIEWLRRLEGGRVPFRTVVVTGGGEAPETMELAIDPERRVAPAFGAGSGSFYLIRPDGHVSARWRRLVPDEFEIALCRALARA